MIHAHGARVCVHARGQGRGDVGVAWTPHIGNAGEKGAQRRRDRMGKGHGVGGLQDEVRVHLSGRTILMPSFWLTADKPDDCAS